MKSTTIGLVIDKFVTHLEATVSPETVRWHVKYLRELRPFCGERRLTELTPPVLREWIANRYGERKPSTQHNAARVACRLCNWAVESGRLDKSPLLKFRKATPSHREIVLSGADYAALIKAADAPMRDVVKFLWHTGARPQEMRAIKATWLGDRKVTFPQMDSKGKRKRRVIYLDAMAAGIVTRLAAARPNGPIFRNSRGGPWTANTLSINFNRLSRASAVPDACAYAIRHTWITRMLEKGVPIATVAALAGNSAAVMLKTYAHIAENESHLRRYLA